MTAARSKTQIYVICALFACLTAIFSQIAIPLPFTPLPINLAMLAVFLAGGLLGARYGLLSQLIYLLLGAVGLPVYAQFTGGVGILVGPTGGYIVGYLLAAFVIGMGRKHSHSRKKSNPQLIFILILGLLSCYGIGTGWFMFMTKTNLLLSLTYCVFPFLIGDGLKILAAVILIRRLERVLPFQLTD